MNLWNTVYVLYFVISVSLIHLMARALSRTSLAVLLETFHGNSNLTLLIDRVIIASFFLSNVGFVVSNPPVAYVSANDHVSPGQTFTILLDKLGAEMLFLGFTLFVGLSISAVLRRRAIGSTGE